MKPVSLPSLGFPFSTGHEVDYVAEEQKKKTQVLVTY